MTQDLFSNPALLKTNNKNEKTSKIISANSISSASSANSTSSVKSTNFSQEKKAYSVSEFNLTLANLLTDKFPSVWVYGEVINFANIKGHWYFSLRDKNSQINCLMFSSRNLFLPKPITNGLFIYVKASANLYSAKGSLQLVVEGIKLENEGDILKNIEELKQKLIKEGIFNKPKKHLPTYAKNIALVTSAQGSVIHDIRQVFEKSWRLTNLFVFDVGVQGASAVDEISRAFAQINSTYEKYDLIVLARGGGSNTDLAIFNDEKIIRAIFSAKLPVISAIGHATDTSLADLIADYSATTPTAAAEKICENFLELKNHFVFLQNRLAIAMQAQLNLKKSELQKTLEKIKLIGKLKISRIDFSLQKRQILKNQLEKNLIKKEQKFNQLKAKLQNLQLKRHCLFLENRLDLLKSKLQKESPLSAIHFLQAKTQTLHKQIVNGALEKQTASENKFFNLATKLDAVSPLKVLNRGFALITDANSNQLIKDADTLNPNQPLKIQLAKGTIQATFVGKI